MSPLVKALGIAGSAPLRLLSIFLLDIVTAILVGEAVSKLTLLVGGTLSSLAFGLGCFRSLLLVVVLAVLGSFGVIAWSSCIILNLDDLASFELESVWVDDGIDLPRPVRREPCQ